MKRKLRKIIKETLDFKRFFNNFRNFLLHSKFQSLNVDKKEKRTILIYYLELVNTDWFLEIQSLSTWHERPLFFSQTKHKKIKLQRYWAKTMQVSDYWLRNVGQKRAEDINLIIHLSRECLILYGSEATSQHTNSTVIFSREKKISQNWFFFCWHPLWDQVACGKIYNTNLDLWYLFLGNLRRDRG